MGLRVTEARFPKHGGAPSPCPLPPLGERGFSDGAPAPSSAARVNVKSLALNRKRSTRRRNAGGIVANKDPSIPAFSALRPSKIGVSAKIYPTAKKPMDTHAHLLSGGYGRPIAVQFRRRGLNAIASVSKGNRRSGRGIGPRPRVDRERGQGAKRAPEPQRRGDRIAGETAPIASEANGEWRMAKCHSRANCSLLYKAKRVGDSEPSRYSPFAIRPTRLINAWPSGRGLNASRPRRLYKTDRAGRAWRRYRTRVQTQLSQ